jgi:hypothetical protein
LRRAATALAAVVLLAGCGGGEDDETAAPPEAATTTTRAAPPSAAGGPERDRAIAPKQRRLEDAGFTPKATSAEGDPALDSAVDVPLQGGAQLTVYAYASEKAARKKAAEFEELARQAPTHVGLKVVGSTVYFAIAEEAGTVLDRAQFDRAVAAAEGG